MVKGKRTAGGIQRQGRRAMRTVRRAARTAPRTITLGDLVAAAVDLTGSPRAAAELLASRELARALGRRIVTG